MSASPQQEDTADRYDEDIEENDQPAAEETEATTPKDTQPPKRGRGRPKGSKNKKSGAASAATEGTPVKKKRGRPPKEKKPDDSGAEEQPAKRRRGRPRKEQKSEEDTTAATSAVAIADGSEPSVRKKRGRPPKKT